MPVYRLVSEEPKSDGTKPVSFETWLKSFEATVASTLSVISDEGGEARQVRLKHSYRKYLSSGLSPSTFSVLCTRVNVSTDEWDVIRQAMLALWGDPLPKALRVAKLQGCYQRPGWSVDQYVQEFLVLAALAEEDPDQYVEYFKSHLNEEILQILLMSLDSYDTFDKALKAARTAETGLVRLAESKPKSSAAKAPAAAMVAARASGSAKASRRRGPLCYYCGEPGHMVIDCKKWVDAGKPEELPYRSRKFPSVVSGIQFSSYKGTIQHHQSNLVGVIADTNLPAIKVKLERRIIVALVDSCASYSLIKRGLTGGSPLERDGPVLLMADGSSVPSLGGAWCNITVGRMKYRHRFQVVDQLAVDAILGLDFWRQHNVSLESVCDELVLRVAGEKIPLEASPCQVCGLTAAPSSLDGLLKTFKGLFAKSDSEFGSALVAPTVIRLKEPEANVRPVARRTGRFSLRERLILKLKIKALLEGGRIRPSKSEWAARVLLVPKGEDDFRMVVDFTGLNALIHDDPYPPPRSADLFDRLAGRRVFSKLDLQAAYLQLPVDEGSKHLLGISTPFGNFEYNFVPFGCKVSGAALQRALDQLIGDLEDVFVYADDILIASKSEKEHLETLAMVFKRLQDHGFLLGSKKCVFMKSETKFLGRIVSWRGVSLDPASIQEFVDMREPRSKAEARSVLGSLQWLAPFIPNFAEIVAPIRELLGTEVEFLWSDKMQRSFETLKSKILSAPVLRHPDFDRPFVVEADASGVGWGAVLLQEDHPVAFLSRSWKPAERKLPVPYMELLAIVYAVEHWHVYLHSNRFTIITDHKALQWITHLRNPSGRLALWAASLLMYDFNIRYRPGRRQGLADPLSRLIGAVLSSKSPSVEEFKDEQTKDEFCNLMVRKLAEDEGDGFLLNEDGVLCKLTHRYNLPFLLPVVPKSLVDRVLTAMHDKHGHLGQKSTLSYAADNFFWNCMGVDTKKFVASCKECNLRKDPPRKASLEGSLDSAKFNDLVACDILGGLWGTPDGYHYILVCEDHYSKLVEAEPLVTKTSKEVSEAFKRAWVDKHGAPRRIHTDQGPEFTGDRFMSLVESLSSDKSWTTAYHPQGDGVVERFNRTLSDMLAKTAGSRGGWKSRLQECVQAHNSTTSRQTGFPPLFLATGKFPSADLAKDLGAGCNASANSQAKAAAQAREVVSGAVRKRMRKRKLESRPRAAYLRKESLVFVKELVRKQGSAVKLVSPWSGPWQVIGYKGRWAVVVKRYPVGDSMTVNVANVKPYVHREPSNGNPVPQQSKEPESLVSKSSQYQKSSSSKVSHAIDNNMNTSELEMRLLPVDVPPLTDGGQVVHLSDNSHLPVSVTEDSNVTGQLSAALEVTGQSNSELGSSLGNVPENVESVTMSASTISSQTLPLPVVPQAGPVQSVSSSGPRANSVSNPVSARGTRGSSAVSEARPSRAAAKNVPAKFDGYEVKLFKRKE